MLRARLMRSLGLQPLFPPHSPGWGCVGLATTSQPSHQSSEIPKTLAAPGPGISTEINHH